MREATGLAHPVLLRWLVLALTAVLVPGVTIVGVVALWALVLQQLGKPGIGLASMMSAVAVAATVVIYTAG